MTFDKIFDIIFKHCKMIYNYTNEHKYDVIYEYLICIISDKQIVF